MKTKTKMVLVVFFASVLVFLLSANISTAQSCKPLGTLCNAHSECCSNTCYAADDSSPDKCQPSAAGCKAQGEFCNSHSDCCSNTCYATDDSSPDTCQAGGGGGPPAPGSYDSARFQKVGGVLVPRASTLGNMPDPANGVSQILVNFLKWLLYILGFIAALAFIVSGLQYLLSAGDEKMVETAKRNLKWSIVGIVVSLASLIIMRAIYGILMGLSRV